MESKLLEIKNLHVHYITDNEVVKAVNGVSLTLEKGEILGLVGETGAGKTTVALSVMQLVPDPPGVIVDGEIYFKGKNLIFNTSRENQEMRGNGISMIFQDPMTALNPIMTIAEQLEEVVIKHKKANKTEAREASIKILELVGVNRERINDYPHQFSGGMKQRAIIAMALLCNPQILIADEPTTALDVTIQAQVLDIIKNLVAQMDMSMLLITHDLGVVAETCHNIAIMYAGEIVEYGSVLDVYQNPLHPYSKGLFESIPKMDSDDEKLIPIGGLMPNSADLPTGCAFHPRCKYTKDICSKNAPEVIINGHIFKCHFDLFSKNS